MLTITTRPEQLLHRSGVPARICPRSGVAARICPGAGSDFLLSHFAHACRIVGPTYMLIY